MNAIFKFKKSEFTKRPTLIPINQLLKNILTQSFTINISKLLPLLKSVHK